jgi:PAS domain S-box-containing protein
MDHEPTVLDDGPTPAELSHALLEAAPDGTVLVDEQGCIVLVNARTEQMFGYDRSELLGQTVELLLPDDLRAGHRGLRNGYLSTPQVRPMGLDLHLSGRRRDGSLVPVEISLSPVVVDGRTYTIASVRDITAQRELQAERDRISAALDASADGVFLLDEHMQIRYANQGAASLFAVPMADLPGRSLAALLPDAALLDAVGELRDGRRDRVNLTAKIMRDDGSVSSVEVVVEAAPDPRPVSYLCLVRDISGRIESERTLRRAEEALLLAQDRERIARDLHDNVIQRLYASGLSLQAAGGLPLEPARGRIEEVIEGIDATIRELRHAIFELHRDAADPGVMGRELNKIVHDAERALGFTPKLACEIDRALPTGLAADVLAVAREALANAAKHARATEIAIRLCTEGDHVRLVVDDDGVGLSPGALRGHGLDNMQARAQALNGDCLVSTRSGGGTRIDWRAPVHFRDRGGV